jgi:hypothetical protein
MVVRLASLTKLVFVLAILISAHGTGLAQAADTEGEEEEKLRQTSIAIAYTNYEWWLLRWSNSQLVCQIFIDHEGLPTLNDIYYDCSESVYESWAGTKACDSSQPELCSGLYLFYVGSTPLEKSITIDLPSAEVYVSLSGCEPTYPDNFCASIPSLSFTAKEPLPNETITALHVNLNGVLYDCPGDTCEVSLRSTPLYGIPVEFWADSSFGDSSPHFTAQVRVIDSGVASTGTGWYVDVISSQWLGAPLASCAKVWQAFPPVGGPPDWLTTPETPALMETDIPYNYLAGRLIAEGLVDSSSCPGNGLLPNGYADACGLELAMPMVQEWQNQFDARIIEVANTSAVPGQLIKNLFAQESQFWPGAFKDPNEFGLGQLTDNGAETILLWNPTFFDQFCPLVLTASACQKGYIYLDEESQAILRGALASQAKADCAGCPAGIDLSNANFTIKLFADTLLANCEQVAQVVYNATGLIPGEVSSYEDLWRFTVANYHVGPGCLSYAMYTAWSAGAEMDWEHVSTYLTDACKSVIPYVEKVTTMP